MAIDPFFMFPSGTFPVNASTVSIANAKTSADLDALGGLELAESMISGASHREGPGIPGFLATVNIGFKVMEVKP